MLKNVTKIPWLAKKVLVLAQERALLINLLVFMILEFLDSKKKVTKGAWLAKKVLVLAQERAFSSIF